MKSISIEKWIIVALVMLLMICMCMTLVKNKRDKEIANLIRGVKGVAPLISFLNDNGELLGINSFKWGDAVSEEDFLNKEPPYTEGFLRIDGELLGINSFKWGDVVNEEELLNKEPPCTEGFLRIAGNNGWLWDKGLWGTIVNLLVKEGKLVGFSFYGSFQSIYPDEYYIEIVGRDPDKTIGAFMEWYIGEVVVSTMQGGLKILQKEVKLTEVTEILLQMILE